MIIFAMPIRTLLNLKLSRENQRVNFCFVCCIHIKNFKAVEFCHRFKAVLKLYNPGVLQQKTIFASMVN